MWTDLPCSGLSHQSIAEECESAPQGETKKFRENFFVVKFPQKRKFKVAVATIKTADVVPRMEAASPALNLPSAAKLRPSPAVPGSMESAIKMWLQVGNVQKLQQVYICIVGTYKSEISSKKKV